MRDDPYKNPILAKVTPYADTFAKTLGGAAESALTHTDVRIPVVPVVEDDLEMRSKLIAAIEKCFEAEKLNAKFISQLEDGEFLTLCFRPDEVAKNWRDEYQVYDPPMSLFDELRYKSALTRIYEAVQQIKEPTKPQADRTP